MEDLLREWVKWAEYKPFDSYIKCRYCGGTWWPDQRESHWLDCLVFQTERVLYEASVDK